MTLDPDVQKKPAFFFCSACPTVVRIIAYFYFSNAVIRKWML